ncbi:MAG: response regulator [Bacteroidota bacterium]
MAKYGPIIIVDDNSEEQQTYHNVLKQLGIKNQLFFFDNGHEALDYLQTTKEDPFLIICDINMPKMDGMELRRLIAANPYLKKKGMPFVFRSHSATSGEIKEAYELSVQGFFPKTDDPARIEKQLAVIFDYWMECFDPPVMEMKLETNNPHT